MNFSSIGVIASRMAFCTETSDVSQTSLMSLGPPFRLDTMGNRRKSDPQRLLRDHHV